MAREPTHPEFLQLQAQLAQAISGRTGLSVTVGLNRMEDDPLALRDTILVGQLQDAAPEQRVRYVRGQVDLAALAMRYHQAQHHAQKRPREPKAGLVFDALEQVRLEALGSSAMEGVKHNLAERWRVRFELSGVAKLREDADPPLADIMAMLVREQLTGEKPPREIATLVQLWRPYVEAKMLPRSKALREAVHSQADYAALVQDLLVEMELMSQREALELNALPDEDSSDFDAVGHQEQEKDDSTEEVEFESVATDEQSDDAEEGESEQMQATSDGDDAVEQIDEHTPPAPKFNPNQPNFFDPESDSYRIYRTEFDEVIEASALASSDELGRLQEQLLEKLKHYHTISSRLATRLQRLLLAQQARSWVYEQQDGLIDNARLSRIVVRPDITDIYKREKDNDFRDTVITLLIDNSGSMRGRPISIAALSADILARTLERCGVKVEILGFTTRDWKGGFSRKAWLENGRPSYPGRLNDIRHIIYKSADQRFRRARRNLALMLKDGILKENIDGEAILWAYQRLKLRKEKRRILMVISDGAPVDDSTLSANDGGYLDKHLRDVIARIERDESVELLAIGIGHDVTRYYRRAVTLHDAEQLGDAMMDEMTELFSPHVRRKKAA